MADIHACLAVRGHQEHMTSSVAHHEKQRRSSAGLDRKETNLRVPRNDACASAGTCYGLGVGPGDPQLLTLKALHVLERAQVVVYPCPQHGESFARAIVRAWLRPQQEEIRMRMFSSRFSASGMYDEVACKIALRLQNGHDVAVLCQGDPLVYGSFWHLFARLHKAHRVVVVPGVSSLTACAAVVGQALVTRIQTLLVLPALLSEEQLRRHLSNAEQVVITKLGRNFPKVRKILRDLHLESKSWYIAHATLPKQRIFPLHALPEEESPPYFSMILVGQAQSPNF